MSSESRSRIMARVRGASAGSKGVDIERELASFGTAPTAPLLHENLAVAFMARLLKNQATVALAADRTAAVKAVGQYLYEHHRSHRLVASNAPQLAAMPWRDGGVLPRFGELEPGEPVALGYGRWGVAETGAVVTLTGKQNPAPNSFLPEQHVLLLDAGNIIPDLDALWKELSPELEQGTRPRGINCIAGPSSTADVEATLVYGAHGPRGLHIVVMGDIPEDSLQEAQRLAGA
ncbi:hypothetical protein EY643_06345 [Halioglobus maricola]|uniref:LUD domain-containing protein n=1 Tax=Halioglobus maricola TaxID=2601894 RepID=A0A5P9NHM7_9GAMM|nr:LUD domain-containing protein [Halioglobus maricola]QFU75301.1 hypothetical protein EY643_06345 [Halioglobus maricola]